jgi:hypothetical protein
VVVGRGYAPARAASASLSNRRVELNLFSDPSSRRDVYVCSAAFDPSGRTLAGRAYLIPQEGVPL